MYASLGPDLSYFLSGFIYKSGNYDMLTILKDLNPRLRHLLGMPVTVLFVLLLQVTTYSWKIFGCFNLCALIINDQGE